MTRAVLFEEHSSVLPHWFGAGVCQATLVSLDAHLDLQFVDEDRIVRLRSCGTARAMSRLESPHPLSPDRSGCFGIEDFLFPASRLGLLRRVVWVAPPHVLQVGIAAALRGLQQMETVTLEELESFHRVTGGWIEGRLLGLELTICDLSQLPSIAMEGPVLVDIDVDYFVRVPDDVVWIQPRHVVAVLRDLVGPNAELTVARSVGSGFLPLRHRFLADHLAALWEGGPDAAAHWQGLLDADVLASRGMRQEALAGLKDLDTRDPPCAATRYAMALLVPDLQARSLLQAQAVELDPAYRDDLVRRICEFRARWKRCDLATVRGLQTEVAASHSDAARLAIAWIALGCLYTQFGRLDDAQQCDKESLCFSSGHPELALEIAKLLFARGRHDAAAIFLDRAASDDETRVAARLYRAEFAHVLGSNSDAVRHALDACQAAPAWSQPIRRLGFFVAAGGNLVRGRHVLEQSADVERRIEALAARLS